MASSQENNDSDIDSPGDSYDWNGNSFLFKDPPSKFNQSEDPSLAKSIADSKNITDQQDLTSKPPSLKSDVSGTHMPTQNSDKQNEDCSSSCRVYDTAKRNFDQPTNHGTNTVSENDLNVNSAGDEDRQVANKISNAANSTKTAEKILEREHAGSSYQGNGSSDSKQTERPLGKSSSDKNEKLTDIKPKGEKLSPAVSSKTQSTSNQNQATVNPSDVPSTHKQEKTYAEGGQTNDQLTDHLRTSDNQSDDPKSQTSENSPIHSVECDREVVGSDVNVTVAPQSSLENQNLKQSLDKEEELMREESSSQGDVTTKTLTKDESVMAEEVVKVDTERNGNIPQKTSAPDLDGARSSLALSPTKSDTKDEEQQNNNPNILQCQSVSTSVNLTENGSIAAGRHKQQTLKSMAEGFRKVLEKFDVLHQDKIKREELINELTQHVSEQLEKPIEMETLDRDMEGSSKSRRNEKGSSKKSTVRASPPNEGSNTQKGNSTPSQHQQFQDIVNIPFPKFMHISMHEKQSIKKIAEQYKVTVEEKSHGFQLKGEDNLKIVGDELRKLVDEIETKQLITSEVEVLAADDFSALKSLSQDGKCCIMHSPTWITGAVEISVLCCEEKEIDKSTLAYPVDTVAEDESNGDTNEESNFLTFKMPPESEKQKYIHAYEDSLKSLFKKANGKDISSLSFPIEAFKNYPKLKYKVLVRGITVALKDFQGEMNGMHRLRNVILCSDEIDPCEELKRILTDASPKYVNSQPIKISTVVGKITEQKVDVLVNTISSDLNLQHGAVAKSICNAAGRGIQQELSKFHGNQIKYGQVAVTRGFKLQCNHVFHGALLSWDKEKGESKKVLQTFVQSCLHHMDFHGYKTIAFPVLGAGNLKIPVQVVAPVMRKTIEDHRKLHPETKITEVKIVCLGDLDKEFREALKLEEPGPHFEMCVENTTTHLTVGSVDPPLIDAYDAIIVLWTKDNLFKVSAHHSKIQGKDWSTRRKNVQEKGFEVTKRDYGKMTINFFVQDENNLKEIEMALKKAIEEGCSRVCIEVRSSDPLAKDCKKFALSVLNAVKKLQKFGLEEVRLNFDQKSLMTSACQALQGPAAVVTKSQNLSLEITGKKSDVAAVRKRLQDFLTVENKQTQEDVAEPPQQAIPRDLPQNVNESKGAIPKPSELLKKGEQTKRDKLVRTKEEECCVILSFKTSPTKSLPQQTDAGIKAKLTSDFQNRKEDLLIVYPFNSPQKALIKCKSADDACSLLRTFKLEAYELKEFEAQALNDLEAKLTQPVIDLIQQCDLSCDEIEANCGAVLDKRQWVLTGNLLEIQAAHSYLKTRLHAERRKDSTSEVSRKTENSHHLQKSGAAAMQKKCLCLSNETIKIMKHFFKDLPFDKVSQNFVSENEISISGNQMNISKFENALESIQNLPVAELNNVCQTEFHTLERKIPTHDDFMLQFMKKDKKVIVLGKNQEQVHAVKDQMVTVLQRQKSQSPGPSMSKGSKNKNFPEGHVAFFPIDELSYDVFRSMHGKDKSYEGKLEFIEDENSQLQMQVLQEKVDDFRNCIRKIESMSKSYVDVDLAVNNLQHVQQQCPDVLISLLYADKIIVVAKSSQELKATEDVLMKVLRSQCVTVFSKPVIKHFCKSANQNIISISSQGTHKTIVKGPKGIMNKIEEEMKALVGMRETYIGLKDVWNDTFVNYLYDKGRSQDNLYVHVDRKQKIVHVCGTERDVSDMMKYIEDNEWHHVSRSSTHQIKKLNITISEGDFLSVRSEGIVNPMDEMKVESNILLYAGEEVKRKVLHWGNAMKDRTIPTEAGSLKQHGAEVIFHVFVPRWLGSQADTVAFKGELFETLKMCFSEAKKPKISSLVIPSFGKVDTHAPDIVCATTYAECVKEFSRANTGTLKDIHFVDSTGEMFDLMNAAFQQPLPWIFRKPDSECQYHLSHQMVVKVTYGDILDVKADALVVREDPECKSTSYPAKVFTAGKRFPENYSKKVKKLKGKHMSWFSGDIHHLDMKIGGFKIFLAIMPDQFKYHTDFNDYKSCMKNVLQKLCDTGIKTVALPFFGGGGRDKKRCAELLVGELHDFSKSTKQRPIVVHIQDKAENLQLIHDEFQSCFNKDKALGDVWQRNAEVQEPRMKKGLEVKHL